MGFTENIKLILDVESSNVKSGLSGLKGDIANAEGGFNKVKVAAGGVFDMLSTSPAAMVAVGGAVAAFASKAISDFENTALAAGRFSQATGLGVEDASRWIEVASDVGIGAGTLETAFGRMEKAIANNRGAFGDLVKTAKDGSVDMSGTFLAVITHLQGIKDPIDRANEASKLFGKGFQGLAEIMGTSADTLKEKLAGVKDGMVIDQGELDKAREYRDRLKDLGDAVDNIKLKAGESLIGPVGDTVKNVTILVDQLGRVNDYTFGGLGQAFDIISSFANPIKSVGDAWQGLTDAFTPTVTGVGEVSGAFDHLSGQLAAGKVDAGGWGESIGAAADGAKGKIDEVGAAFDLLKGKLSVQDATLSLQDSFAKVGDTATAAFEAVQSGSADAAAKVNDNQQAVNDLEQKVVSYGEKVLGLPPEQVTNILALIDEGKLTEAQAALDKAAKDRTAAMKAKEDTGATSAVERAFENTARTRSSLMQANPQTGAAEGALNSTARNRDSTVTAHANTGSAEAQLNTLARDRSMVVRVFTSTVNALLPHAASGGVHSGQTVVGERGPEIVDLPAGSFVHTAAESSRLLASGGGSSSVSSVGGNITINMPPGTDPSAVVRNLNRWTRRNGTR